MFPLSKEKRMLTDYHERQLDSLEQGFNDISACSRRNRMYVLFLYDDNTVCGTILLMNKTYLIVENKMYLYRNIGNIYSYFTLQPLSIEQLFEWFMENT